MKTTNKLARFACAFLAVITVVVSLPLFGVEVDAVEATRRIEHKFDFSDGTADEAIAEGGYVNSPTDFIYAEKDGKIVAKGTKGMFTVNQDVPLLAKEKFSVEMRFNIASIGSAQLSLIALNLKTSSSATAADIPLVRLKPDQTLEMRGSDGVYQSTSVSVTLDEWHTVKVIVDAPSSTVDLYFDGEFVNSLAMVNIYSITRIRIMHNKTYEGYIDSIHYRTVIDTTEYDEYIDFEDFAAGTTLTSDAILATDTVSADRLEKVTSSNVKVKADPDDASNMVSYNSGNEYMMFLYEKNTRLATTSFVASMDVRFSEFPTVASTGEDKPTGIFSWVFTQGSDIKYGTLCRVDSKGNLLNTSNVATGKVFELEKWTNVAILCDGTTGAYDVFFDGEYVFTHDVGAPKTTDTNSYIRIFNASQGAKFSVCVDNVMLYESPRTAPVKETDVIWDVDFESLDVGTKMTKTVWSGLSDVADSFYVNNSSGTLKVAEFNGGKAYKVTNGTNNDFTDLYMGNREFDPMRTDALSLKFDFNLEAYDETVPAESDTGRRIHHLVSWRRLNNAGEGSSMRVLSFNYDKKFVFLGNVLDINIEQNKTYPIEIIFNSRVNSGFDTITLKIDDKTFSTSNNSLYGENKAYFLDDAGIKHLLPYTGFIKCYLYDADGNAVTDADGNFVFVDKFVARKNFYADTLRLFQGSANSTADYYIDNFKAEVIKPEFILSTDFTGWESLEPSGGNTDYIFHKSDATLVNENGNTYAKLAKSTSQKVFYPFGDKDMKYYGKDMYLEFDVNFATQSEAAGSKTSFVSFTGQRSLASPFGYNANTTYYTHFLYRDELGNLYFSSGNSATSIGQLKFNDWTKIGIYIHATDGKWTSYDVFLDGEYVGTNKISINVNTITYSFRIRAINNEMRFDNVLVYQPKVKVDDLKMDFESTVDTDYAMSRLGGGWMYGALDATRTNTDGETVKTAQILGEEGAKYLRVDHSKLKDTAMAYVDATNELFIDEDDYLIETAIRFTSTTGSTLNVAEIYRPKSTESAPILAVRGDTNYMYVILRGVQYDLVYRNGTPIVASGINDSEFTKVAILVDSVNGMYTVYVNDRVAYYKYDEKVLPCADMPLHFIDKDAGLTRDAVRLLEMSQYKYQDGILDVDYLNLIALGNGIGSEIKGTQTKAVSAENTYSVRFVSGIDSLYGAEIGYEITAVYTDNNGTQTKNYEKSSNQVFEKVSSDSGDITAESLESSYLAAIEIVTIPKETAVEFTVEPYVSHGGVRIYGESYTVKFSQGAIVE